MKPTLLVKADDHLTDCDAEHRKVSSINSNECFTFDSDGVGTSKESTFGCNIKVQILRFQYNNNRSIESLRNIQTLQNETYFASQS